jgi:hypothetical protein
MHIRSQQPEEVTFIDKVAGTTVKKHKFNDERKDEHVQSPKPKIRKVKQVDTKTFADKQEKIPMPVGFYMTVQSSEPIKLVSVLP